MKRIPLILFIALSLFNSCSENEIINEKEIKENKIDWDKLKIYQLAINEAVMVPIIPSSPEAPANRFEYEEMKKIADTTQFEINLSDSLISFEDFHKIPGRKFDSIQFEMFDFVHIEDSLKYKRTNLLPKKNEFWKKGSYLGLIQVSTIKFNDSKSEAELYIAQNCGFFCKSGWHIKLSKNDNNWKLEEITNIWVS